MDISHSCPMCDRPVMCRNCTIASVKQYKDLHENAEISKVLNSDLAFVDKLDRVLDIIHRI